MTIYRRPRVAIESPYAGDPEANERFAEAICRFAVLSGYAPYAMHLHNTRFLNDLLPEERAAGIEAGLAWADMADEVWFCLRPGEEMSSGMKMARDRDTELRKRGVVRRVRMLTFSTEGDLLYGWEEELTPLRPTPYSNPNSHQDHV